MSSTTFIAIEKIHDKIARISTSSPVSCREACLGLIREVAECLLIEETIEGVNADQSAFPLFKLLKTALCSAIHERTVSLSLTDIGRQRWDHVQPYLKETRITAGVQTWYLHMEYCFTEALTRLNISYHASAADKPVDNVANMLCAAILAATLDDASADILALFWNLRPSRARITQYGVDAYTIIFSVLLFLKQCTSIMDFVKDEDRDTYPNGLFAKLAAAHLARCERRIRAFTTHTTLLCGPSDAIIYALHSKDTATVNSALLSSDAAALAGLAGLTEESPAMRRWRALLPTASHIDATHSAAVLPRASIAGRCTTSKVVEDIVAGLTLEELFVFLKTGMDADSAPPSVNSTIPSIWLPTTAFSQELVHPPLEIAKIRHEVCEWEWPLLNPAQLAAKTKLDAAIKHYHASSPA